jgi:hypothetical protein
MMKLHREDTDESRSKSEETAHLLLTHADLPLVFRARACMILGCSGDPGYVEWAKEAVRIAELGIANAKTVGENERTLLQSCQKVLKQAEADFKERGGYDVDEEADKES